MRKRSNKLNKEAYALKTVYDGLLRTLNDIEDEILDTGFTSQHFKLINLTKDITKNFTVYLNKPDKTSMTDLLDKFKALKYRCEQVEAKGNNVPLQKITIHNNSQTKKVGTELCTLLADSVLASKEKILGDFSAVVGEEVFEDFDFDNIRNNVKRSLNAIQNEMKRYGKSDIDIFMCFHDFQNINLDGDLTYSDTTIIFSIGENVYYTISDGEETYNERLEDYQSKSGLSFVEDVKSVRGLV